MEQIRLALDQTLSRAGAGVSDARTLGEPITDDEWVLLQQMGLLDAVSRNRRPLEEVADAVLLARRTYARGRRRALPRESASRDLAEPTPTGRQQRHVHQRALADLFALDVETDDRDRFGVARFRRRVLQDALLAVGDVDVWIQREAKRQGRPTIRANAHGGWSALLLAFSSGTDVVHRVAVRRGGVLDRLRAISVRLATTYPWHEAEATTYVLTGCAPVVPAIWGEVQRKSPLRARSRIVLTVDPACTPVEVADAYRRLRRRHFGRVRRLTAKYAKLAIAAFRCRGLPVAEQLKKWNATARPHDRYTYPSTFRRESQQALNRLAELGLGSGHPL